MTLPHSSDSDRGDWNPIILDMTTPLYADQHDFIPRAGKAAIRLKNCYCQNK